MRFSHIAFLGVTLLCTAVVAACSSSGDSPKLTSAATGSGGAGGESAASSTGTGAVDAGSDAPDIGTPSTMYPAPHAAPPHVITYGGPVLASPKIVPVFFSNDDPTFVAQLQDFVSKVGATNYWITAVGEYGVGAATGEAPINLTETAPTTIDDTAIQTWLQGKLNGDDPAWPAADANTVYVLHYPAGVTVTLQGEGSCTDFGGYHSNTTLDANHGGINVAYAVVPRCTSFGELMGIDAVTGAESHELIEASTDPYPESNTPAYATIDDAHIYWERLLGGGEVGDMCAQFPQAFTKFPELAYTVQRTWSNKAAAAGHDPCVPTFTGEGAYYNATPDLTDTITMNYMGETVDVKGVEIPLGASKTIDLDLFSDGPTSGPFTVEALDFASLFNPNAKPDLTLSLDASEGLNGQKLHLTITVDVAGKRGTETFLLISKLNGNENWWIGIVGTPAPDGGAGPGPTSSSSTTSSSSGGAPDAG
jgi:hypothetical protein